MQRAGTLLVWLRSLALSGSRAPSRLEADIPCRPVGVSTAPWRCRNLVFFCGGRPTRNAARPLRQSRRRPHRRTSTPWIGARTGVRDTSPIPGITPRTRRATSVEARYPTPAAVARMGNGPKLLRAIVLSGPGHHVRPGNRRRAGGFTPQLSVLGARVAIARRQRRPARASPAAPGRIASQADLGEPGGQARIPPVDGPQRQARDSLQGWQVVRCLPHRNP